MEKVSSVECEDINNKSVMVNDSENIEVVCQIFKNDLNMRMKW